MEPETTEILWCLTRRKDGTIGMMFSKEGVIQALKRGDVFPFEEYQRSHAATPEMLELAARKRRRGRPKSLRTVSMHLSIVDRYYTFRREGKTQEEARELIRKQFRLKGSPRTIDQAISDWGDAIEELLAEESWERMLAVAEVQEGMSEEELERTIEAFHASDYCDECYRYKYQHLDNGAKNRRLRDATCD